MLRRRKVAYSLLSIAVLISIQVAQRILCCCHAFTAAVIQQQTLLVHDNNNNNNNNNRYDILQRVPVVVQCNKRKQKIYNNKLRLSYSLTSALESNTPYDDDTNKMLIDWFDPITEKLGNDDTIITNTTVLNNNYEQDNDMYVNIPLYPLPACYVPTCNNNTTTYTIRNTERRNIQMALDLEKNNNNNAYFCVVLRAIDTGRFASIGTIMKVITFDKQYYNNNEQQQQQSNSIDNIQRIIVTCIPIDIVEIISINNPYAATLEYRLQNPNVYLQANVRTIPYHNNDNIITKEVDQDLCNQIANEYNLVRELYNSGVGIENLPPFSKDKILSSNDDDGVLPIITSYNVSTSFWSIVEIWQTLCNTIKEGQQINLSCDRNELLIDASIRKGSGGMLKLPIHISDILPEDRQKVYELEQQRQQKWLNMKLDPCIDFQILLQLCNNSTDRLQYFYNMIFRERKRLENLKVVMNYNEQGMDTTTANQNTVARTNNNNNNVGAWFNDECW